MQKDHREAWRFPESRGTFFGGVLTTGIIGIYLVFPLFWETTASLRPSDSSEAVLLELSQSNLASDGGELSDLCPKEIAGFRA